MTILDKLIPNSNTDTIHVGEAYSLWSQAAARYDTLELAQHMENLIHDKDLKALVKFGISSIIQPQINRIEDFANKHKVSLPDRPPKNANAAKVTDALGDEEIFRIIFDGVQTALLLHIKEINLSTNDSLRNMYKDFLKIDLDNYESMIKYGKLKGWIKNPPKYELN